MSKPYITNNLKNLRTFSFEVVRVTHNGDIPTVREETTEQMFNFRILQFAIANYPSQLFEIATGVRKDGFSFIPPFDKINTWKVL